MAYVQFRKCLTDRKQMIKLVFLIVCVCVSIYQLSGCFAKILHPPVTTYYTFTVNETIRYPALTICRKPGYKDIVKDKYGFEKNLMYTLKLQNFPFNTTTIDDFLKEVTYSAPREQIATAAYSGAYSFQGEAIRSMYLIKRGLCLTLIPPKHSDKPNISGGYLIVFNIKESTSERDENGMAMHGFHIYIHDHDEVMIEENEDDDYTTMESVYIGRSESVYLRLEMEMFNKIPSHDDPCESSSGYSRSKCEETCVHRQIAEKAGCVVPWIRYLEKEYPNCSTAEKVVAVQSYFANRKKLLKNCKCLNACNLTRYRASILQRGPSEFGLDPVINLYFTSMIFTTMTEVIGYDWNNFLADIGGSLGFLLGISVIGVVVMIEKQIQVVFKKKTKKEQKKDDESNESPPEEDNLKNIVEFLAECDYYEKQLEQQKLRKSNLQKY